MTQADQRDGAGRGTYAALAATVLGRPPTLGQVRLVAVDGRAGSGKTTFAGRLSTALRHAGADVAVLHTDDFLDGWGELLAWRPRLERWVFEPFKVGDDAAYRRYDWAAERLRDAWEPLPQPDVLVVEGVGSASAEDLTLAVFVWAPRALRLRRGLLRDGEALRPQWERWMDDEDRYYAGQAACCAGEGDAVGRGTGLLIGGEVAPEGVDVRVDGAPEVRHDPEVEYIEIGGG